MINSSLKIASVSLPVVWADKKANIDAVSDIMAGIRKDTDLVVLPELFSTAFVPDPDVQMRLAEPDNGETVGKLKELAAGYRMAIAGSYLACDGDGRIFNRAFFVEPSGETTFYDKRHLFSLSPESSIMSAGTGRVPVVRYRGWNIGMIVCYDLRFPVWCRNVGLAYDVMLVPSNWPSVRGYAFEHLLIGRAIENQAYYVGANRGGADDYGDYDGMTFVFDQDGRPVGLADSDDTRVVYVETSRDALERSRKRMPASSAADQFSIII